MNFRMWVAGVCAALVFLQVPAAAVAKQDGGQSGPDLAEHAVSAVMMDAATGALLFEKNSHQKLAPASITKIMTMLLAVEALEQGRVRLEDRIRTSERAASMGGSQIFLEPGEEMTFEDMMKGIAVASANDASVAVAEFLAGTEAAFVEQMNRKARELGMRDTHFVNCNGLPAPGHYTSAYDIAVMSRELVKHSQALRWTSIYEDYLRKDSDRPFWLVNTNKLVRFYQGVDGLKTGYTEEARYCLSATAKKGDFRVIAVVMGEPTSSVRNAEVARMLDWAFQQFEFVKLYGAGDVVGRIRIEKGVPERAAVVVQETVGILLRRGETPGDVRAELRGRPAVAPKHKGEEAGRLTVLRDGRTIAEVPLYLAEDVRKAGWWEMLARTWRGWIGGRP